MLIHYRLIIVTALIMLGSTSQAMAQEIRLLARITGTESDDNFGRITKLVRGSFLNDTPTSWQGLVISAPLANSERLESIGKIYVLESSIEERPNPNIPLDSIITDASVIIEGDVQNLELGANFQIGDFNGDGTLDVAVLANGRAVQERNTVSVFYGPFTEGTPRLYSEADVRITSDEVLDNFGLSLAVVENNFSNQNRPDGLLIGAFRRNSTAEDAGNVFYFPNVTTQATWIPNEAATRFTDVEAFSYFGVSLIAPKDMNGDNIQDVIVGASRNIEDGFRRGKVYVFFGPLSEGIVSVNEANLLFLGEHEDERWGNVLHDFGDVNKDGLSDIGIVSTTANQGSLALAYGRTDWADTLRMGSGSQPNDTLILFRGNNIDDGIGIAAEFGTDLNKDGKLDFLLGAPRTNSLRGSLLLFNEAGNFQTRFAQGQNVLSEFAVEIVGLGNISSNDPFDVDDIAVSAPGEQGGRGRVYIYQGLVRPPSVSFSVSPSRNLEIGANARIDIRATPGSRPIDSLRLVIFGKLGGPEIIEFDPDATLTPSTLISSDVNADFTVRAEAIDDLGILNSTQLVLRFASRPEGFDLVSLFDPSSPIEISGNRGQTITFASETANDSTGRKINYEVFFSSDSTALLESSFSGVRVGIAGTPSVNVSFVEIADFLLSELVPQGEVFDIFWTIRASNGVLTTLAKNGPRRIPVQRGGLDPFFSITTQNVDLTVNGFETEAFTFEWAAIKLDDPNAFTRYEFRLLTDSSDVESSIFTSLSADRGFARRFNLSFAQVDSILIANDLKQQAIDDTVRYFYTIIARINDIDFWPANNGVFQANLHFIRLITTSSESELLSLPLEFTLEQNYPNPFNPTTTLRYSLPSSSSVRIEVFNLLGQTIYSWRSSGPQSAGNHEHHLNAFSWASGLYLYRIFAGNQVRTGKMTLVK